MDHYKISITKFAKKQLDKLPDKVADVLIEAIYKLADNPYPFGHKKLKGRDGYRIRSGDYRIIYEILNEELIVTVIAIGHRKDIYN